ncbi:amidase family protein [Saccharopolyspora sp. NPDC050389]|uniref:amidase family protein n=1 Tax=Saccharopolyspora sp. NPDC050389 TaxID=3155516 RepID=UPI0034006A8D
MTLRNLPPSGERGRQTYLVNYTGFAAATMPCGTVDGLPVGLQVIGRPGSEATVLRACRALEQVLPPVVPAEAS